MINYDNEIKLLFYKRILPMAKKSKFEIQLEKKTEKRRKKKKEAKGIPENEGKQAEKDKNVWKKKKQEKEWKLSKTKRSCMARSS